MFVSPESSPGRNFYPRPPRGGRRNGSWPNKASISYFYPRPPRGGRRIAMSDLNLRIAISIHALREEGDPLPCCRGFMLPDFYPRPPRGGRLCNAWSHGVAIGISIHALREEGDVVTVVEPHLNQRFLSTPSARRATLVFGVTVGICKFLSTPSARRATSRRLCAGTGQAISIHALREEGDDFFSFLCYSCTDFYPRPPRGGRRCWY